VQLAPTVQDLIQRSREFDTGLAYPRHPLATQRVETRSPNSGGGGGGGIGIGSSIGGGGAPEEACVSTSQERRVSRRMAEAPSPAPVEPTSRSRLRGIANVASEGKQALTLEPESEGRRLNARGTKHFFPHSPKTANAGPRSLAGRGCRETGPAIWFHLTAARISLRACCLNTQRYTRGR
jgi:hypothetical protein